MLANRLKLFIRNNKNQNKNKNTKQINKKISIMLIIKLKKILIHKKA